MGRSQTDIVIVLLTLEFCQEGNEWVGVCRELGTSTFHKDLKVAKEELMELVLLHLNALEDAGERKRVFREKAIKLYRLADVPTRRRLDVPISRVGSKQQVLTESVAMPVGCC